MRGRCQKRLLMVCVGNLCRSPMAEAVMREVISRAGLEKDWHVDSASIEGWHTGSQPDSRVLNILSNHNIEYKYHQARQLTEDDFVKFDYIFGMDPNNMESLKRMAPQYATAKLLLLGDFGLHPDNRVIEDPYYELGEAAFEKIFAQCNVACECFLKQARANEIM
ncbi:uncharacterized protein Dwil_GK13060 [Drosophila willistoni]|uniref:Low molecular weight phosphotyrosine protein phosphatase n=1 Tax=Drosophila willistoni TaxID=7260 RepID=B4NHA0_DROWI|nr:low molecular weight phosphotyrosine protein phosphatase 2 [Drosophila willistoni]EDW84576.1 uncharacterized protein Dwil_GK13060 [Drosophila willistoni]